MGVLGIGLGLAQGAMNAWSASDQNRKSERAAEVAHIRTKELMDINQKNQMDMWNNTNVGAQKKHIEDAGMNAGLLYGMGGGGSATTGSGGGGASGAKADVTGVETRNIMELGLMDAQKKLLEAQTQKATAEAEKTKGVDTELGKQGVKEKEFMNGVNELITKEGMMTKWSQQTQKEGTETDKTRDEYEAWKKGAFDGKATDEDTPMSRAIRANLDKATTELQNAKANGDLIKAETVIKGFEKDLAERGIDPKSPWWGRYIGRLLQTIGVMTKME